MLFSGLLLFKQEFELFVFCLVFEELVDIFDSVDPEFLFRDLGKIEIGKVLGFVAKCSMKRPFSQRNFEWSMALMMIRE